MDDEEEEEIHAACRRAAAELQEQISAAHDLAAQAYWRTATVANAYQEAQNAAMLSSQAMSKVQQAMLEIHRLTAEARRAAQTRITHWKELEDTMGRLENERKLAWTRQAAEVAAREHAVQQKTAELRLKEQVLMAQQTAVKISLRIEKAELVQKRHALHESKPTARALPATAARPTASLQPKTTAGRREATFGKVGQIPKVKDCFSTDRSMRRCHLCMPKP